METNAPSIAFGFESEARCSDEVPPIGEVAAERWAEAGSKVGGMGAKMELCAS